MALKVIEDLLTVVGLGITLMFIVSWGFTMLIVLLLPIIAHSYLHKLFYGVKSGLMVRLTSGLGKEGSNNV